MIHIVFLFAVAFLVLIFLFIFWIRQFFDLMARSDSTFPGKHDKLIWAAVILLTGIFGAFLSLIFKTQEGMIEITDSEKPQIGYSEPCLECGKNIPPDATKCPFCGWSYTDDK